MPSQTVVMDGLKAYAGQRDKQLILQMLQGLTAATDLTLMTGIKSRKQFTKLTVESRMRPFSTTFQATNSGAAFSDREIVTRLGKAEYLVDVTEFLDKYLEDNLPTGTPPEPKKESIPFSQQFWSQQMLANASDLDNNTIYNGVYNPLGDKAKDITDGFGTIIGREIADTKLVANATGAITVDDAVEQVKFMYRRHAAKYRTMPMNVYMSYGSYDKYCDNYKKINQLQAIPQDFLQRSVEGSDGKCLIKPALWMGDSQRLLVTPKENLVIGTDRLSDMNTIRVMPDMWVLKAGIAVNIGCQIRDLEVLQVNDKA